MAILLISASGGKASEGAEGQVKEGQPVPESASNCWIKPTVQMIPTCQQAQARGTQATHCLASRCVSVCVYAHARVGAECLIPFKKGTIEGC